MSVYGGDLRNVMFMLCFCMGLLVLIKLRTIHTDGQCRQL